jgi:hypothetical protein
MGWAAWSLWSTTALVTTLTTLPCRAADARVIRLEITRREPFAGGAVFGRTGPYEKIVGRFLGELEAAHPVNRVIVDLDRAPRAATGRVTYAADFYILKPLDPLKGNHARLYDVNNRGNKLLLYQLNDAPLTNNPTTLEHAGNGFLMRHGFTIVWSGWIPDLLPTNHALRLEVPVSSRADGPIEQLVWDEFLFNTKTVGPARLSFPPVTLSPRVLAGADQTLRHTGCPGHG